ncbi:MAG: 4Fe-4S binding protein [Anaerolineae bacterium]|nr:4Fe-4S binding protein [Anaerolineae bacterium]
MDKRDPYEKLIRFYDGAFGRLPNRDEFKQAVQEALSEEDLELVLLVPGKGIPIEALERRAARAGVSRERLHRAIDRLLPQGFLASYVKPDKPGWLTRACARLLALLPGRRTRSGRIVLRLGVLILTEVQSRRPEDDAMRRASAHWMNAMIEDAGRSIPNKTPYKRVLAIEETVAPPPQARRIAVNQAIPDTRAVLPIDILSEMLKKEEVIAVADCYCRSTKRNLGEGCDHPLRTCFYFDKIALLQISSGRAERIDYDEAMQILRECEDAGLVHTVDNNRDRIGVLCNCCACCCPLIKSHLLGGTNVAAPSRFVVAHDPSTCQECGTCVAFCPVQALTLGDDGLEIAYERCIGCGVCVSKCPAGSMRLVLREEQPPLAKDAPSLERRIAAEALYGMLKSRITGKG